MKKQSISEMMKEGMLGRHLSVVYTCGIGDQLGKANLQEHRKINKIKFKCCKEAQLMSPSLTFQFPLKN